MAGFLLRGARVLAASLMRVVALFAVVHLVLGVAIPGLPRQCLWAGLHWIPDVLAAAWELAFAASVLIWAHLPRWSRTPARVLVGSAALLWMLDSLSFYLALAGDELASTLPIPPSLAAALAAALWVAHPPQRPRRTGLLRVMATAALDLGVAGVSLLAVCVSFGTSDHRQPADAIVVFGAGVTRAGLPSRTLRERTATACRLWSRGLARNLVMSGGLGAGAPVTEPVAMQQFAVKAGVDPSAISVDEAGVNTRATVANCAKLASERGWQSLLMVSHDYHLLRIKMFCRRAGLEAYTVPAEIERPPDRLVYAYVREMAALVHYYFTPQLTNRAW